jgi:hypothetical protein
VFVTYGRLSDDDADAVVRAVVDAAKAELRDVIENPAVTQIVV